MAGTTGIDRVLDAVEHRQPAILDLPQRHHTHIGGRPLARQPTRGVLAADVAVPLPRVDQQQRDAGRRRVERHRRRRSASGSRSAAPSTPRRTATTAGRANPLAHRHIRSRRAARAAPARAGRYARPAAVTNAPSAAHSSAADDDSPDPISTSLLIDIVPPGTGCPAIAQRPHHPGHVAGPAGHLTGLGAQRNPHRTVDAVAAHGDRVGIRRARTSPRCAAAARSATPSRGCSRCARRSG